jgi:uncharacterized protein YdeI (YjbR/CyaY-like superfamily)
MPSHDPRIDAYIEKAQPFAQPILRHLRELVHQACPDVEESLRWSMPSFGHKGIMANMAAFKGHCTFGFWKGSLLGLGAAGESDVAMGQFGRITSLADLPPDDVIVGYVREAARLNEEGVKPAQKKERAPKPPAEVPADLAQALAGNDAARATFEGFAPGQRREYVDWITEAKTDATRAKRLATTLEWLAEGKKRNWKYEKC